MRGATVVAVQTLEAIGLALRFVVGAMLGVAIAPVVAVVSAVRGGRAVHFAGVVCRAELHARDAAGAALAGPALVRLSGAFEPQHTTKPDVLGVLLRLQSATSDPSGGDQDLLLGTFTSFATAGRDRLDTRVDDYLANTYHSVTPWWLRGVGAVHLQLTPLAPSAPPGDRLAHLDDAIAAGRAAFALIASRSGAPPIELAELRLVARTDLDGRALRASMWRTGRGVRPLGLRNGIRSVVYPVSQLARSVRGG